MKTLVLTAEDIKTIARDIGLDRIMDETIAGLESALREYTATRYQSPMRGGFDYRSPAPGLIEWMPVMEDEQSATIKMVGYHPVNPAHRDLPTILSITLNIDVGTGHVNSVVDGTFATAVRTGAASAVASGVLAQPDSTTVGLVGCGAQAVTQLHALSRVFPVSGVLLFDIDAKAIASFAKRLSIVGLDKALRIQAATPDDIMKKSDIVCTQTSVAVGDPPVVNDVAALPHLHINAVGSDFPGKAELPASLLHRSLVCPDFTDQAIQEGECQQLEDDTLGPDLVELIQDSARFQGHRERTTVFDSTGWSLEDHVVNRVLVDHARRLGLGQQVRIETINEDPRSPYSGMTRLAGIAAADAREEQGS